MKYFKKITNIIHIPKAKTKINIVNISDLHYSNLVTEKALTRIIQKITELKPDYITITGDTIDSTESIDNENKKKIILNFLSSLALIAPTIISIGNHDFYKTHNKKKVYGYPKEFWNQVKNIPNIHLLDNQTYQNQEIEFFGYTQPWEYYSPDKKEKENEQVMIKDLEDKKTFLTESSITKIGLIHSPTCITNHEIVKKLQNFDLILSGHMHNGCVIPILDEIWKSDMGLISASKKLFPHNCRGRIIKIYNNKIINIIIAGALTTFSKHSPKLLHPFDKIFPYHINQIIITNKKEEVKESTYQYYK